MTRAVVVDDHGVVRMGLVALLNRTPDVAVVGEAASGAEALQVVRRTRPNIVILDLRLPDMDGVEVCRQIKSISPETEVIIVSSFADENALVGAIVAGAKGYVLKSLDNNDLLRAIETVAKGGSAIDPALSAHVIGGVQKLAAHKDEPAFTKQELALLRLIAQGKTNREIGQELYLSEKTVRNYISNLLAKHNMKNRAEAAAYAVSHGLLDADR